LGTQKLGGVDKVIKATWQESSSRSIERGELRPEEFVSLAGEVIEALQDRGIERTIIFGDEANHFDPGLETEIIRRNFEVFARKNVQFVLTAKAEILERVPHLRDAFPGWLEVKGFEDQSVLEELLAVYSESETVPVFAKDCVDLIWKISEGNPREIQRLCQECASLAISRSSGGAASVDMDVLARAIPSLYRLSPR
jgi:hypothetical protein